MESARAPESASAQARELARACEMARKLQTRAEAGGIMSNSGLMFAGGAVALIVITTLVIAFFTMTRRTAAIVRVKGKLDVLTAPMRDAMIEADRAYKASSSTP
jgi:hypothetical protein